MISQYLPYWLAAIYLPEIGPRTILRWLERFPDVKTLFQATAAEWHEAGLSDAEMQALRQPDWTSVEKDLAWAKIDGQHLIALDDERYPPLLKEIIDPPLILFVRGSVAALQQPQVALVGSRHATPAGLENAKQFAYALASAGIAVTSGLALGIDGAAHRGALLANNVTIGVMGTGQNYLYPSAHRALALEMIAREGAVISEFPLGMRAHAINFPRRNRVIAGLSMGVLVVEAALKSGSLITARYAMEQGREVFAIPGSIHNPLARGCHHLIRQGAKLVETAQDVIEELGALGPLCVKAAMAPRLTSKPPAQPPIDPLSHLTDPQRKIYAHVGYEITPLDMILLRSQLTAGEVSSMLLVLELDGYIQSVPGGYLRS